ncbi:MAG: phosphatase PAP2-related protein [Cyclobacteriaceae bacterium]
MNLENPNQYKGWSRTIIILGLHLLVIMAHSLVLALGETRDACAESPPLYDLAHDLAAQGHWFFSNLKYINHDIVIFSLWAFLLLLIIRHPQGQLLFRRYLLFHSMMSVIRATMIFVTTIPSPNGLCRDRYMEIGSVFERSIGLTLSAVGFPYDWHQIGPEGITCCDIIISGHTSMLIVLVMVVTSAFTSRSLRIALWMLTTVGFAGVITVDRHYTVDMLITLLIGWLIISWYTLKVKDQQRGLFGYIEQQERFGFGIKRVRLLELIPFTKKK